MFNLQNYYRKSEESQKEMKILLDVYKGAAKDLRDKVEVKKIVHFITTVVIYE